jgi:hypothetical protein
MKTHAEKIKQLEQNLKHYNKRDNKRLKYLEERKQIKELKKQIKNKKYAGIKQTGKNLKIISSNVGRSFTAIGKGIGKFSVDPKNKKKQGKRTSVSEIMRNLPQ